MWYTDLTEHPKSH